MAERISRKKFVHLGAVLGVSAAGSSLIAACGGGSGGSGSSEGGSGSGSSKSSASSPSSGASPQASSSASASSAASQAPAGQAIAKASDVAPGSAKTFKDEGNPAVLVHLEDDSFAAYSAVCTHQACTVTYQSEQLACPCHGSVFDPANGGQVVNGPAQTPLPEIPVKVQGGNIVKA